MTGFMVRSNGVLTIVYFYQLGKTRELPQFIFLLLSLMLHDSKLMLKLYYLRVPTSLLTGCDTKVALGRDPLNQNSNRSDREKRTTSKGGPVFSKLFRLDRTDPLSFGPKFPESLVEWIVPWVMIILLIERFSLDCRKGLVLVLVLVLLRPLVG